MVGARPHRRHRSTAEVERAFDAADRAGRILMEAFMYRHHPQTKRLAELAREGAIGELRLVRSSFSFPLSDETNVRLRPELDGGSLMDVGCYCVSGSRLLAGEPVRVSAHQVVGPTGVDVRFAATMSFPGGALAHFDCGFDVAAQSPPLPGKCHRAACRIGVSRARRGRGGDGTATGAPVAVPGGVRARFGYGTGVAV